MLINKLEFLVRGNGPEVCGHHGLGLVTDLSDTGKFTQR